MKRLTNLLLILLVGVLISAAIIYVVFIAVIRAQQGDDALAKLFVYIILGFLVIWGLSRIFSSFTNHGTRYSKRYIVSNPEDADTLVRADLRDLDLEGINLEGKSLNYADLQNTNLVGANLRRVEAYGAIFLRTNLSDADLKEADLSVANLRKSQLDKADLRGTILYQAFLRDASFIDTKFETNTKLPDGTWWRPDVDLERYTNPKHSEFWEPDFDPRDPRR